MKFLMFWWKELKKQNPFRDEAENQAKWLKEIHKKMDLEVWILKYFVEFDISNKNLIVF